MSTSHFEPRGSWHSLDEVTLRVHFLHSSSYRVGVKEVLFEKMINQYFGILSFGILSFGKMPF